MLTQTERGLPGDREAAAGGAASPQLLTTAVVPDPTPRHRVRVWFGPHVIADYSAEPDLAARYAAAMRRRFGLPVTIDPIQGDPDRRWDNGGDG